MKDPVSRLTPLGVMVLALLREDDMHPYEMIRLMRHRHDDRIVTITNGTMYHTVARLQQQGLLAEVGVDREGNRPERTTYALTDAGNAAVVEWVRRELPAIERPAQFRIALAESHNLPREEAIALLTTRRESLERSRDLHRDGRDKALEKGVPDVYLIEVEREGVLLDAELAWLDGLLHRIARPDYPWNDANAIPTDLYLARREAARQ
ncbi:MAG: transcriptional regulator [Microbacterium sp. SCN 70-27]|uniref:PadR family transcriptional regulator n=1 Tax=unclassified Microbacterium TaxID=2609290 RepID=UPI000868A087|nr:MULTISPECIES: PadR family transcriptional regulator [unclassified Microbacterium]MBN9223727.1 PadR family transcriptional regulator [Microbacterium sp.]ODT28880.1 MAG: transcriptional regulator [Microbacterium sp. SCN 70-27]